MKGYKKLLVWQKGIELCRMVYELTSALPSSEKFGLASQMNRCVVSIPSNIAEGSSRRSERDYYRFLEIARGSIYELETQSVLLLELKAWIVKMQQLLDEEAMMLHGLMRKMNINNN